MNDLEFLHDAIRLRPELLGLRRRKGKPAPNQEPPPKPGELPPRKGPTVPVGRLLVVQVRAKAAGIKLLQQNDRNFAIARIDSKSGGNLPDLYTVYAIGNRSSIEHELKELHRKGLASHPRQLSQLKGEYSAEAWTNHLKGLDRLLGEFSHRDS